jgi:hypothetical protein
VAVARRHRQVEADFQERDRREPAEVRREVGTAVAATCAWREVACRISLRHHRIEAICMPFSGRLCLRGDARSDVGAECDAASRSFAQRFF